MQCIVVRFTPLPGTRLQFLLNPSFPLCYSIRECDIHSWEIISSTRKVGGPLHSLWWEVGWTCLVQESPVLVFMVTVAVSIWLAVSWYSFPFLSTPFSVILPWSLLVCVGGRGQGICCVDENLLETIILDCLLILMAIPTSAIPPIPRCCFLFIPLVEAVLEASPWTFLGVAFASWIRSQVRGSVSCWVCLCQLFILTLVSSCNVG